MHVHNYPTIRNDSGVVFDGTYTYGGRGGVPRAFLAVGSEFSQGVTTHTPPVIPRGVRGIPNAVPLQSLSGTKGSDGLLVVRCSQTQRDG